MHIGMYQRPGFYHLIFYWSFFIYSFFAIFGSFYSLVSEDKVEAFSGYTWYIYNFRYYYLLLFSCSN